MMDSLHGGLFSSYFPHAQSSPSWQLRLSDKLAPLSVLLLPVARRLNLAFSSVEPLTGWARLLYMEASYWQSPFRFPSILPCKVISMGTAHLLCRMLGPFCQLSKWVSNASLETRGKAECSLAAKFKCLSSLVSLCSDVNNRSMDKLYFY